jgi:hypothetical protein
MAGLYANAYERSLLMKTLSRPAYLRDDAVSLGRNRAGGGLLSALALTAALFTPSGTAYAQTVNGVIVTGDSNPYLSGMPNGSTASGDSAPAQSPVQVTGLNLSAGGFLTFAVTGSVSNTGAPNPTTPPDGSGFTSHGAENGMGGYNLPLNSLVGVFLTDAQPSLSAAPPTLDFSTGSPGLAFASLSPQLKQVFFIGDALTGTGSGNVQQFNIPAGATRLFLGTSDGFGWFNNSGQFTVNVTQTGGVSAAAPEPSALSLAALGILGITAGRRARRR